jgi:hypothetical protein
MRQSAEVSPGKRPITFVRRRTSTKGALELVRAADPLAMARGEAQVLDELVDVALDDRHPRTQGALVEGLRRGGLAGRGEGGTASDRL